MSDIQSNPNNIFGLDFNEQSAKLILLPVPWDATASYKKGTAKGPKAILEASGQIDLADWEIKEPYAPGIFMLPVSEEIKEKSARAIQGNNLEETNKASDEVNAFVESEVKRLLAQNKLVGIIGGEHSVSFGSIKAQSEKQDIGILHIDAHLDGREAYQGYNYSHASIMYNSITNLPGVKKIVSVGIRDFCQEEMDRIKAPAEGKSWDCFSDVMIAKGKITGSATWKKQVKRILKSLPKNVYFSLDIDGLEPHNCPNTGTVVPGGLQFNELLYLITEIGKSKKHKIVGFDLVEVAPDPKWPEEPNELDANVGMRVLYKLCQSIFQSQGLYK